MFEEKSFDQEMSPEARKRLDAKVMGLVKKKPNHVKASLIGAGLVLALTGSAIAGFQMTGKDAPTGQGDVLAGSRVMSQAEYDSTHNDVPYSFDGFLYTDALNLQLRFSSNEELENFSKELKPLQTEKISAELKEKFAGNHIEYGSTRISTKQFTELHKEDKALWIKCYLPSELLTSNIRAYDTEDQLKADTKPC